MDALGLLTTVLLATLLAGSAVAKLATLPLTADALGSFLGVSRARGRSAALGLAALELLTAAALLLWPAVGRPLAAGVVAAFFAVQAAALARGRAGEACGCLGPRSRVTAPGVAMLGVLLVAALWLAISNPAHPTSTQLAVSVAVVALIVMTSAVAVAWSLAQELAALKERSGPQSALEMADEGPQLGDRIGLPLTAAEGKLAVAVFTSPACGLCRNLAPAIDAFAKAAGSITLTRFDEEADARAWAHANIPGSPFVVVCDDEGTVLAKGAFNTVRQLESVCATAQRRLIAAAAREPGPRPTTTNALPLGTTRAHLAGAAAQAGALSDAARRPTAGGETASTGDTGTASGDDTTERKRVEVVARRPIGA